MKKILLITCCILFSNCKPPNNKQFTPKALAAQLITDGGHQVLLKDVIKKNKGKTLVIDVWASWCSDCIKGLPALKTIQKNYPKAKYVFISLDKNQKAWKRGIVTYKIKGTHYYVSGGWKSVFAKNIDLDWIPRYILVDKTGKVLIYRAVKANDADLINTLEELNI